MHNPHHKATLLAAGWLALCVAAVALGQALRLGPAEAAYAWPLGGAAAWLPAVLFPAALAWSGAAAVLLLVGAAWAGASGTRAAWARLLLIQPLLLAFIWLVWPADGRQPWAGVGAEVLMLAAVGLAAGTWWGWRHGHAAFGPAPRPRDFIRDGLFLVVILAAGHLGGQGLSAASLTPALVTYPLFAMIQLLVFLVLPAGDLRRCGASDRTIALSCGLVFGLVHWPNPLLAAATGVAMAFWIRDRLRGRGLVSLAVGMGILGAVFSQGLPDSWTGHMRAGPGYIRQLAREDLAAGRLWFTPGNPDWDANPPLPAEFLGTLYPGVVGRPITAQELALWEKTLDRARRRTLIWQFLTSAEYTARQIQGPPPDPAGKDTDTLLRWKRIITLLDSDEYWQGHGGTWQGYLAGLYGDLLGRKPSPEEAAAWTPRLNAVQRREIVGVLLDNALQWRDRPPRTLSFRRLVAPQVPVLVTKYP